MEPLGLPKRADQNGCFFFRTPPNGVVFPLKFSLKTATKEAGYRPKKDKAGEHLRPTPQPPPTQPPPETPTNHPPHPPPFTLSAGPGDERVLAAACWTAGHQDAAVRDQALEASPPMATSGKELRLQVLGESPLSKANRPDLTFRFSHFGTHF